MKMTCGSSETISYDVMTYGSLETIGYDVALVWLENVMLIMVISVWDVLCMLFVGHILLLLADAQVGTTKC
ncbi:hypothetical protein HanRHA438_Chr12g0558011 [Helianthus annuus]|uniref:Transmembrane protein n=1 Tax=Helianthus annuus TaxID=4232 RepID=A0A9K3MWT2_HELAN|nr:hypothetical protein HanXRQr2_Chr12g0546661 [Helianthus annuus]KAJ0489785.1 hypothetical protein HanHA300_Chr12g0447901 [Helianthus annuus]KAJ0493778.1 hypothetical protein HanIR_Chr12g0589921 [Helianthus annuus]KAJ0505700.1 hypothetical protein HanHA89_Chr12g0473411 [Helianthus annuus]KAJ0675369.1 hypothetical protein HanLR1_Chr12g0450351 [Helianthus annuus]